MYGEETPSNMPFDDEFKDVSNNREDLYTDCRGTEASNVKHWIRDNNPELKHLGSRIYHRFVKLLRYVNRTVNDDYHYAYKQSSYLEEFDQQMIEIAAEIEQDYDDMGHDIDWRQSYINRINEEIENLKNGL